jgi:TetR/AcrR family acrAB operon transcriptional repressor
VSNSSKISCTRQHILQAALRHFANDGYAATSVQQIVNDAKVSKPALYYYFKDKAGLFEALVDHAHDERYRLMQEGIRTGRNVAEKLEEMISLLFDFAVNNQELMRLAFATAFASSGSQPCQNHCREKGLRNFELIKKLLQDGQASGELKQEFDLEELAMGIYGQLNTYVMVNLFFPDRVLDRRTAGRIVDLFMEGARQAKTRAKSGKQSSLLNQVEGEK